jgi:hypothetical protein
MWVSGLAALMLVIGLSSAAMAADKANVAGTWKWTTPGRNGGNDVTTTLKLKQDGDKITGTVTGGGANATEVEIKEPKLKDNELTFKVVRERNGTEITTSYSGKVEGDTITGKIEAPGRNGAAPRPRDWKATREKSEKVK